MRFAGLAAAAALFGTLANGNGAAAAEAPRAPEPAKAVDVASFYAGRWYEVGRTPMKLTDGCVAGTTDYQTKDGGLYQRDACRDKTPAGKEKVIGGSLKILNPGRNTKVHVKYQLFGLLPINRDYWMLDHTDAWFIMATPDLKLVHLYTRDATPAPEVVANMTQAVKAHGYAGELEFPAMAVEP